MLRVMHVVGARPNFMKVAPVFMALLKNDASKQVLVHTGQHYDASMSEVFLSELGIPEPDINLEVGSGSHAEQTAQMMIRFERVLLEERPDLTVVYGDVNSTIAASLVCSKALVPVAHVEAGLRSFDRTMPEEINRLLTDQIADFLFTPSADADRNLLREGVSKEKIHLVGNVMIDTLVRLLPEASVRWDGLRSAFNVEQFGLVTLHRPSNVDDPRMLDQIMTTLNRVSGNLPLIFPMHPRTRRELAQSTFRNPNARFYLIEPLGYLDFLALQQHAVLVITDSGGIQEETSYMGVPCLTVRENTERPVTVNIGSNILVGQDMERLEKEVARILEGAGKMGEVPPLWDGYAGERIGNVIMKTLG